MMPDEKYIHFNSSVVKDVSKNGGDVSEFVPACVKEALFAKYSKLIFFKFKYFSC